MGRRAAGASLAFEGGAAAVAFDVHLEDGGVVDEAVDDGERHRLVGEDLAPFAERLVGGDEQGSPLVSGADEFEQHAGFGLILGDVGEVVEDQQMVFVELGDGGFESEFAAGNLQPLDEIGGAGEQHAPAVFDKGEAESCRQGGFCRRRVARTGVKLAPLFSQASPAASAMTWALLTTGTASKSKVSRVLPGGSRASARWRSMRRRLRSAISCSARAARKRAGRPAFLVGLGGERPRPA